MIRILILVSTLLVIILGSQAVLPLAVLEAYAQVGCFLSAPFAPCSVDGALINYETFTGNVTSACVGLLESVLLLGMVLSFEGNLRAGSVIRSIAYAGALFIITLMRIPVVAALSHLDLALAFRIHDIWYGFGGLIVLLSLYIISVYARIRSDAQGL